jgi:hypothetical protein
MEATVFSAQLAIMQALHILVGLGSVALLGLILWEVFETIVLPQRVSRRLRLTRIYFRALGWGWFTLGQRIHSYQRRENALAVFGPLSLLLLLALWASLLIVGFAGLQWALGSALSAPEGQPSFATDLYFSGTTFLTLGLGDVSPRTPPARFVSVVEVGTGFGLLALVIGYLPVLYQSFSRREVSVSLLDAHAGSPPTAGELLRRRPPGHSERSLLRVLGEWERWSAELLESHLSYPVLAYFRSQHDNQSWVAALTMILDACALVQACQGQVSDELAEQAHDTYAMARHVAVDMTLYLRLPKARKLDRLPAAALAKLESALAEAGLTLGPAEEEQLVRIRHQYEPYLAGLAAFLVMPLPPWVPEAGALDDWESTA